MCFARHYCCCMSLQTGCILNSLIIVFLCAGYLNYIISVSYGQDNNTLHILSVDSTTFMFHLLSKCILVISSVNLFVYALSMRRIFFYIHFVLALICLLLLIIFTILSFAANIDLFGNKHPAHFIAHRTIEGVFIVLLSYAVFVSASYFRMNWVPRRT